MNSYVKDIRLSLKIDEGNILSLRNQLKKLTALDLFDKDKLESAEKQLSKQKQLIENIAKLKEKISEYEKLNSKDADETLKKYKALLKVEEEALNKMSKSSFGSDFKSGFKDAFSVENIGNTIGAKIGQGLIDAGNKFISSIGEMFSNAWQELDTMLSYSQMTDSNVRNLRLGYGLSAGQAYGVSKAADMLGISSEEDYVWMNSQQRQQFQEAMTKYSEQYSRLYDSGFFETLQEYQFEMEDFKQEMQMEIIEFFMNNKELIKSGMSAIMTIAEGVLDIINWLTGGGQRNDYARNADRDAIISSYTNSNKNNVNNVNMNFTGVSQKDATWLSNSSTFAFSQIKKVLDEGA